MSTEPMCNRRQRPARFGPMALLLLALPVCAVGQTTTRADAEASPAPTPRRHNVLPLPVFFYSPETRWAAGAAVLHAYRVSADARPITTVASALYTQNRQAAAELGSDAYIAAGRYHLQARVGYAKFPSSFYGIGNATPASAEEAYTPRAYLLETAVERRIAPALYLGFGMEYAERRLLEVEPGGALASGSVPGSAAGVVAGLGALLTYDTRDNTIAAQSGGYARLQVRRYDEFTGSDYAFTRAAVDLRAYRTLPGRHVVALQGAWTGAAGEVPFDRMAELGGQNLRGYYQGRYRDRQSLLLQAEYRTPMWRRLGLAAFGGMGEVASEARAFTLEGIHPAAGAGLRVLLNRQERLALRLDWGFGRGDSGFYIGVGEAF